METPDQAFQRLQELAEKYGPGALELARASVRTDGIASIVIGFICGIIAVVLTWITVRLFNRSYPNGKFADNGYGWGSMIGSIIIGVFAFSFAVSFCMSIFEKWNWIAMVNPDLWLAHVMIAKVGQ